MSNRQIKGTMWFKLSEIRYAEAASFVPDRGVVVLRNPTEPERSSCIALMCDLRELSNLIFGEDNNA